MLVLVPPSSGVIGLREFRVLRARVGLESWVLSLGFRVVGSRSGRLPPPSSKGGYWVWVLGSKP